MTEAAPDFLKQSAKEGQQISEEGLETVSNLVKHQLNLEADIAAKEQELKDLKKQYAKTSTVDLPSALSEYGIEDLTVNGKRIIVKKVYSSTISKANQEAAFNWLRENDYGDIIKNTLTIVFGQGEEATARKTKLQLMESGLNVASKEAVHAQTLKAFVKEQLEKNNEDLPKGIFGVYEGKVAEIK